MAQFSRDTILEDLRRSVIEVYFTKVNGEDRAMRCTLREDILPPSYSDVYIHEEKKFHEENKDVIRCWSMHDNGWRSFRVDAVKYMADVSSNYV